MDFGLVNKANYYTGLLFRGYAEGYGMPVLSGGRYDALIGDFGSSHPATGFAVNVNAVANIMLKNNHRNLVLPSEILVYAEENALEQGFIHCRELASMGIAAENSLHNSLEEAKKYARKKGIKTIEIVSQSGDIQKIQISD